MCASSGEISRKLHLFISRHYINLGKWKMEDLPKRLATSGAPRIAEKLRSISGGKVLDVATGNGGFIDTLMKALRDYDSFVGIDKSRKEVESARRRFEEQPVEIMEMNAEAMEFEHSSFDTVCISFSLHHLGEISKVLAEMKRVLKSGSYFIVQEPFCDGEQTKAQKTDILQHHWDAEIDSLLGVTHNKTFTKRKIEDLVNNLKLEKVEVLNPHTTSSAYSVKTSLNAKTQKTKR